MNELAVTVTEPPSSPQSCSRGPARSRAAKRGRRRLGHCSSHVDHARRGIRRARRQAQLRQAKLELRRLESAGIAGQPHIGRWRRFGMPRHCHGGAASPVLKNCSVH